MTIIQSPGMHSSKIKNPYLQCIHKPPLFGTYTKHLKTDCKKDKGSPYSITESRVPKLISVLGSHPAGGVSHKPGGRLPLLSARPAVTTATLKRAPTNFAAW